MSRNKKLLRNIVVLIIIYFILFPKYNLYLTPLSAYRASEKSSHYGPSDIAHIQDHSDGKYILAKYDRWLSANSVRRSLFFFWTIGDQYLGFENDPLKDVVYTWGMNNEVDYKIYGIINNDDIKKLEIILKDGSKFTQTEFYDHMFLFTWTNENNKNDSYISFLDVKGYDKDNNLIFEEEYDGF